MLSTKLGYGRPAALAIFLAAAFLAGVNGFGLPKPLGLGLSQTCFFTLHLQTPQASWSPGCARFAAGSKAARSLHKCR